MFDKEYSIYNAILKPYLGEDVIIGKKYRSPILSREDSTPSFCVREHNGRLTWKDFGFPDATGDKIENLLMHIWGISFWEAREIIEKSDFPIIPTKAKKESEYTIKYGSLDFSELLWWDQYHISARTLKKYKVYGLRKVWRDKKLTYDSSKQMAFVYLGENRDLWQIYAPKKRYSRKWMQRNGTFLLGFEQLPLVGETLLIVSGMKDGLALYEATKIPFISGCGEGDTVNIAKVLPELKLRFRNIFTLLDPDTPGRKATAKFQEVLKIPPHPFLYPNAKDDLADLSKRFGLNYLRQGLTYK